MTTNNDYEVKTPEEIATLSKEELFNELETLVKHEDAGVLTEDQAHYLDAIRDEMFKRMAVGGPHGDYTGKHNQTNE